jgi:lipooligosaccharide transport system permease protein
MVATALARTIAGGELRPARAAAVTERNAVLLRAGGSYGWLVLAGFAEPLIYLLAVGWGVGSLVGGVPLGDGRVVPYRTFLAPAMLAVSAMNGAMAEATINFFAKLRYWRLYEPMLNTPVTPEEIAVGELGWAALRGAMYSVPFLAVMVALGLVTPRALAALPAALLASLAFGAMGLALSTFMRSWRDFDYLTIVQFALFMFSGTFVPVATFPPALQAVVHLTPLFHGVELIRAIALDRLSWGSAGDAGYLAVLAIAGLAVATRRMRRLLWK